LSTVETPLRGSFRGLSDLPLVGRQLYFEQLAFWLNPIGAGFTIGFSLIFIIFFESLEKNSTVHFLHFNLGQYYLPAFMAYGVMAACFSVMTITLVNRRELGLLKRLRLSPVPAWMLLVAMFLNWMIIAMIQIALVLVVGLFYGVHGPHDVAMFIVVVVVGMLSFTAMGVGISVIVPNADSAAPIVSLVFFILIAFSGLYFPIAPHSGLSNVTNFFPIRRLILATVDSFNGISGTSVWDDLGVIALWGVAGAWIGLRRWDWSPKRS
jgi:ABC-2 type transport system permease protein